MMPYHTQTHWYAFCTHKDILLHNHSAKYQNGKINNDTLPLPGVWYAYLGAVSQILHGVLQKRGSHSEACVALVAVSSGSSFLEPLLSLTLILWKL